MFQNIKFSQDIDLLSFIEDKNKLNKVKKKFDNSVKIKFFGGYTLNDQYEFLKYFLKKNKINSQITENLWGPAYSQFGSINKCNFKEKNIFIIINSWRDLISLKDFSKLNIKDESLLNIFDKFLSSCSNKNVKLILTEFSMPEFDISYGTSFNLGEKIKFLNLEMKKITKKYKNCEFLELYNKLSYFSYNIDNQRNWYSFGKLFDTESSVYSSYLFAKEISKSFYSSKKVLVTDLDNTLWGGIIGDDGEKNVKIGNDNSEGRIFTEIQLYLKMLKNNGIILAIISKNEEKIALNFLNNERNILKPEDFACYKINWDNKYKNLNLIQNELNLGLDSFVFLDDNPMERLEVKKFLPEVSVPEIGEEPENYIKILNDYNYFDIQKSKTKEDLLRTKKYIENQKRNSFKNKFNDQNSFMKSLKICIKFHKLKDTNLERVYQLTNKTNQFNFNTIRLEKNNILNYKKKRKKIMVISASDTFGDHGIISIVYISCNKFYEIDNWVMSCRVFSKSIEKAIFTEIFKDAKYNKYKKVNIKYTKSDKNRVLLPIIDSLNLNKLETKKKTTSYQVNLTKKENALKHFCKISYE